MRILYLFMMFSIVGWLWETPWVSIKSKEFINRGFLRGPYIPIYGCAIVTIVFTMGLFENLNQKNIWIVLLQIVYMAVITAVWEFVTSYILEKLFKTRWWDYSSHKFNIQGRISLYVTVFFGLGGYTLYRFVLPVFDKLYTLISINQMNVILSLFYLVFIVDSIITVIELFKTRNIISQIESISKELSIKMEFKYKEFQHQYKRSKKEFSEYVVDMKNNLTEKLNQLPTKSITLRIKDEIQKLNTSIGTAKRLNRFYRKYPNSKSFILFKLQKTIENISSKKGDR